MVIEHELASAGSRILAWIIDAALFSVLFALITFFIILPLEGNIVATAIIIFLVLLYFTYDLWMELFNQGQTLGKRAVGIRVIKLDRSRSDLQTFLIRSAFRMLDINLCGGSFAFLFIVSSPRRQRLGDLLAHTAVVKTESRLALNLSDLLRIETIDQYKPQYPQAKLLQDEDVITIRQTLDRYRNRPNPGNTEALHLLVDRLREYLDIEEIKERPEQFLKILVKDYIVLTR